jgi:spore maturation protein CgeB
MLVTTKPFEMGPYKVAGARDVMLVLQGYDDRFAPVVPAADTQAELGSEVCFIGHCESHYAGRLAAARRATGRLRIWGPGWVRYARFHPWVRAHVVADGIWGARYPLALACSKIALGLLSKRIPETTTTRTFEIPAMAVFMLAERTDDHLALFREGIEAEFFGSDDELQEKIVFYLKHDNARLKIAAAGRKRCVQSGYRAESQIEKVLTRLTKLGN